MAAQNSSKTAEYMALFRALESKRSRRTRLFADPFYLGQAMLGPKVTLGDNDDAIVYFGLGAEAGALAAARTKSGRCEVTGGRIIL